MADLFVFHTPNLSITTVANSVRFISNLKLSPKQFELCGGGKTNSSMNAGVLSHSRFSYGKFLVFLI
ncbi:hypothetical protein DF184_05460 [Streptococcus suis]|nr:hypothetical protein DF184_05460 [Streptococcus suis]